MALKLPPELLIQVIENVVDCDVESRVALQASHPITKTLCSLALTSKEINHYATKLLYNHCMDISSRVKLDQLRRTLDSTDANKCEGQHQVAHYITKLALYPYQEPGTSLFDELEVTNNVAAVLAMVAPSLRRLVFDGPLRTTYPGDDHAVLVRPQLNAAFKLLVKLEEFCSVRDELYLNIEERNTFEGDSYEPHVWSIWPQLRKLAVYNVDLYAESAFNGDIGKLEHLTHLVLPRPDGRRELRLSLQHCRSLQRVVVVDFADSSRNYIHPIPTDQLSLTNPEVVFVDSPIETPYWIDNDKIYSLQKWVRGHVIEDTIWDMPGSPQYTLRETVSRDPH